MTLKELVSVMNIYEVECFDGEKMHRLNMVDLAHDPVVLKDGNREVRQITNIARQGVTIWLKEA